MSRYTKYAIVGCLGMFFMGCIVAAVVGGIAFGTPGGRQLIGLDPKVVAAEVPQAPAMEFQPEGSVTEAEEQPLVELDAPAETQETEPTGEVALNPGINDPHMTAYQETLEYAVPPDLQVPRDMLRGFNPVVSLVNDPDKLVFPVIPANLDPFKIFVDDPETWDTPYAGYRDGNNWSCESTDGWCADNIQAFNWKVWTGYEICHPAVACIQDPDGGAAMLLIINFHDSDEVWNVRIDSGVYVDNGFSGFGQMWDLSGGTYDVEEAVAAIRNHYLYNLGHNEDYAGQCGSTGLCKTATYAVVYRMWDRPDYAVDYLHYQLVESGQWVRP